MIALLRCTSMRASNSSARFTTPLNIDNYDNSDSQTDYFDVGHYTSINLGSWNKPFIVK